MRLVFKGADITVIWDVLNTSQGEVLTLNQDIDKVVDYHTKWLLFRERYAIVSIIHRYFTRLVGVKMAESFLKKRW